MNKKMMVGLVCVVGLLMTWQAQAAEEAWVLRVDGLNPPPPRPPRRPTP